MMRIFAFMSFRTTGLYAFISKPLTRCVLTGGTILLCDPRPLSILNVLGGSKLVKYLHKNPALDLPDLKLFSILLSDAKRNFAIVRQENVVSPRGQALLREALKEIKFLLQQLVTLAVEP
jgi:hypothetical protein